MKFITQFENFNHSFNDFYNNRKYWLVPTDERLKPALKKIGCDEDFISRLNFIVTQASYIFVCQYEVKPDGLSFKYKWEWNRYKGVEEDESFKDITYMGRVDIQDFELDADKYNL